MSLVTRKPIDLARFLAEAPEAACGALASFVGIVRNHDQGRAVKALFYECYESMAEKTLAALAVEACRRWPVDPPRIVHRVGLLEVGEAAVAISVSAAHRAEAFEACRFLIERIKTDVPIWKKEMYEDGASEWVLCTHPHDGPKVLA